MASGGLNDSIPQWKKDLIIRKRNQSKCLSAATKEQCFLQLSCPGRGRSAQTTALHCPEGQEPRITCSAAAPSVASGAFPRTDVQHDVSCPPASRVSSEHSTNVNHKMVQDCAWTEQKIYPVQPFSTMVSQTDDYDSKHSSDTDSSEELQYGPGIVSKLKNKYLSLTLREKNVRSRPTILPMRKAASLEDLLDDEPPSKINGDEHNGNCRRFESRINGSANVKTKNIQNRYRNSSRGNESLKRARSVETISSRQESPVPNDDVVNLIVKEGNENPLPNNRTPTGDKNMTATDANNVRNNAINKPKRLAPLISEKEKPPCDVVKQNKMIFEGRPEKRTKPPHKTGEVAAKLANFKAIIDQNKKPPIKPKPDVQADKTSKNNHPVLPPSNNRPGSPRKSWKNPPVKAADRPSKLPVQEDDTRTNWSAPNSPDVASLTSPIPDISRTGDFLKHAADSKGSGWVTSSLSETPDLILHSSPNPALNSPTSVKNATEIFLETETKHNNVDDLYITPPSKPIDSYPVSNGHFERLLSPTRKYPNSAEEADDNDGFTEVKITQEAQTNIRKAGNSITFALKNTSTIKSHLPKLHTSKANDIPASEPLKLITNGLSKEPVAPIITQELPVSSANKQTFSSVSVATTTPINNKLKELYVDTQLLPPRPSVNKTIGLTEREKKKNLINTEKTLEQPVIKATVCVKSVEEVVPKPVEHKLKPPKKWDQNQQPQQIVYNFVHRTEVPDYIEDDGLWKLKAGISIPGASQGESSTEDDDWQLSLGGPPSPCDVLFINDNILIDGRSSLSSKTKKPKMRIKFIETNPEIFEYPSESSLLDESSPMPISNTASSPSTGHTVPSLNGTSSLANYTPKSGFSVEDFQLGVTRSTVPVQLPPNPPPKQQVIEDDLIIQEADDPVLFSAGTNSDILF